VPTASALIPFGNHRNSAGDIRPNYPATFVFGAMLGVGAALITMAATGGFKATIKKEEDFYAFHNGLHQAAAGLTVGLIGLACFLIQFIPISCIFSYMDTLDPQRDEEAASANATADVRSALLPGNKHGSVSLGRRLAPWALSCASVLFSFGAPIAGVASSSDASETWENLTNSPTIHCLAVIVFSLVVTASVGAVSVGLHACCGTLFCKSSSASNNGFEMSKTAKYSATQSTF